MNPDKLQLLNKEIREAFKSVKDITFDSIANLKYLNACIKEGLRIYPPVPVGSPRAIPEGGKLVLGQWIPPETRVSVHHWSTYHSEANFKNPFTFAPERFLGDPVYANDHLLSHQPFGFGHRNCLGQNMAMHEIRLIFATFIFEFDIELCGESRNWPDQRAFALWLKNDLLCRLKPVNA